MLNDDDKKFVEDEEAWFEERKNNAPPGYAARLRLCRIIRELEYQNDVLTKNFRGHVKAFDELMKLKKEIDDAPSVWAKLDENGWAMEWRRVRKIDKRKMHTHRARLVQIEEVK